MFIISPNAEEWSGFMAVLGVEVTLVRGIAELLNRWTPQTLSFCFAAPRFLLLSLPSPEKMGMCQCSQWCLFPFNSNYREGGKKRK